MTIKRCPNCIGGQMLPEMDEDGKYRGHCLQCGYQPPPATLLTAPDDVLAGQVSKAPYKRKEVKKIDQ